MKDENYMLNFLVISSFKQSCLARINELIIYKKHDAYLLNDSFPLPTYVLHVAVITHSGNLYPCQGVIISANVIFFPRPRTASLRHDTRMQTPLEMTHKREASVM